MTANLYEQIAAELVGRKVITRHADGPTTYAGPDPHDPRAATLNMRARGTSVSCHPSAVAPADEVTVPTIKEARGRVQAKKNPAGYSRHPWTGYLDGRPVAHGRTKRDVTATALVALAVSDWQDDRRKAHERQDGAA